MKNNKWRILLILVAVACFGVALSYPIRYRAEQSSTENALEQLTAMRDAGRLKVDDAEDSPEATPGAVPPEFSEGMAESDASMAANASGDTAEIKQAGISDDGLTEPASEALSGNAGSGEAVASVREETQNASANNAGTSAQQPETTVEQDPETEGQMPVAASSGAAVTVPRGTQRPDGEVETSGAPMSSATPEPTPTPTPTPTVNRYERTGALTYPEKEKVTLDMNRILPEFQEIYELNNDLVGWLTIPGIGLDSPVVQSDDSEFYLHHDFFGEKNANGQIILDTKCDPYTPSYNLVISGHNMRSGKMFGNMVNYMSKSFWEKNKLLEFDTLMERKLYVVIAAFFSADYDVDEEGFRYNADIQYSIDLKTWMRDIKANQIYDTGIETEFGDEFLTLTTCNKSRRTDGRFVVICRKVRDGEEF